MIGAIAYDDPAKDAWRGWKWNAIAHAACGFNDRIPPREKARRLSEKTVLYLVGPNDHDRRRAMARGFANHNLIAVDMVQERVDEVRMAGGLAVCGSLQQVLLNWPHDWQIDVVDADLCSGVVSDVMELPECLLFCPAFKADSVMSINLMRGRDSASNKVREMLKRFRGLSIADMKHRSSTWLINLMHRCLALHLQVNGGAYSVANNEFMLEFFQTRSPRTNSYKSKTSGQWFDSVVHRWSCDIEICGDWKRFQPLRDFVSDRLSRSCSEQDGIRHRIAALRAVRTMKMRAA